MPKITDPTDLTRNVSVAWDISAPLARTITISSSADGASSLVPPLTSGSDSGVSGQALYSFAKEEWKNQTDLIRIPFPFISITKTQFDLINNWNYFNDSTRYLIRDAGWAVISGSDNVTIEEWVGIVSLGTLADTDQVYFQQSGSAFAGSIGESLVEVAQNFVMSGSVNQAVMQYSASAAQVERNFRTKMKIFVREYKKTYSDASIQSTLSVPLQEYTVYSLPLQNATDTNITTTVESEATGSPYNEVTITYLSGSGFTTWTNSTLYAAGYVVQSSTDLRWYLTQGGGTTSGNDTNLTGSSDSGITDWLPFQGERIIQGVYYPFNKIVDLGAGKNNSIQEGYTRVQFELRSGSDIDDGTQFPGGTYIGKTADLLLSFVGATIVTATGVYIDNFQDADTNSIDFYDAAGSGTVRRFAYVATGIISFNSNLSADLNAEYFMFFTDLTGEGGTGTFGQTNAVVVEDNLGLPITGSVGTSASVSFTFDYDNNVQGGRTADQIANVTVVAIGLSTAQYVLATGTIARSKANSISLVSALERNYSNP